MGEALIRRKNGHSPEEGEGGVLAIETRSMRYNVDQQNTVLGIGPGISGGNPGKVAYIKVVL